MMMTTMKMTTMKMTTKTKMNKEKPTERLTNAKMMRLTATAGKKETKTTMPVTPVMTITPQTTLTATKTTQMNTEKERMMDVWSDFR